MSGRVQVDSAIMAIERPSDVVQRRPAVQPVELNVAFLAARQGPLLALDDLGEDVAVRRESEVATVGGREGLEAVFAREAANLGPTGIFSRLSLAQSA
ncbi:hypothetical protein ASD89_01875 [Caulobacter sp. Root656]|nr:hypothetical protein ASD89_01875 [Caulobacter sp. Root656]